MDVNGKAALITGGASGIGKAIALRLAAVGAKVLIADIDEAGGLDTAKEIAAGGGEADFIRADVTRDEEFKAAFKRIEDVWGGVDVVVNNAGILTGSPAFPETPPEKWKRVVDINLGGVMRGTQLGIEALSARGGGVIVNTASLSGINPWAMDPIYSATKAGVVFFTKAMAGLKESKNIRVNCVCPTLVETPLLTAAEESTIRGLVRFTRLGPDHVADAVMRLIEDDGLAGAALRVVPDEEPSLA
jgi:NAD(P)-dependent dehydrogenase (short-subunit alcohol dehydrogenase family)